MILKHVCLEGLHAAEDNTTDLAGIFPLCPDMGLVSVANQQLLGNASMSTDVANILGLPDMHHVHMMLQIALVREPLLTSQTLYLAVPIGCDAVHLKQMLIVEENVDWLVAVLAVPFDVPLPIVEPDLVDQIVHEVAIRLRALLRILRVWGEVKGDSLRGPVDAVTGLPVLLNGHVGAGLAALVTHLLQGVLDSMLMLQVQVVGSLLPEKRRVGGLQ